MGHKTNDLKALQSKSYIGCMQLLDALAMAFINTFGITQPTEKTLRQAAWFIFALMVLTVAAVVALGMFLMRIL
jgi:hypothetical protein